MKKALSFILAVFMVASVLPFSLTASAEKSGYYTYSVSNGEATITDVDASISGDVTIGYHVLIGPHCSIAAGNHKFDPATGWFSARTEKDGDDNLWRIFDKRDTYDPKTLPRDTSLRRAYAEHLEKDGMKVGSGRGIFFFDGEKFYK